MGFWGKVFLFILILIVLFLIWTFVVFNIVSSEVGTKSKKESYYNLGY